jgi:hypothetical protein
MMVPSSMFQSTSAVTRAARLLFQGVEPAALIAESRRFSLNAHRKFRRFARTSPASAAVLQHTLPAGGSESS